MFATTRTFKAAALLLALIFGVLIVQEVGAERVIGSSKKTAEELAGAAAERCGDLGGTAEVHYNMASDGSIDSINVTCDGGGGSDKSDCTYYQGVLSTTLVCALVPGSTAPSEHAPVGGGVLEEGEPSTDPVHGDLGGGTLDPTDSGASRPVVRSGTFGSTAQVSDDDDGR